ncbi:MAG: hypothetical protein Q9177_002612 [Variospora cf. flavescens]
MTSIPVPFVQESELYKLHTNPDENPPLSLPGHPRVSLQDAGPLRSFLYRELWAVDLERMAPHLWIMSTQSSTNITPLHQQKVKGREIIVTEDPRLHLVWIDNRIFIKPLPRYLLSHQFWSEYLSTEQSILRGNVHDKKTFTEIQTSALGLLRTYYFLIRYESDLRIACENSRLLPSSISWPQFCAFSEAFSRIHDDAVSERYHYGELRLTRLNLYAKPLIGKFQYERIHGQYSAFFARFYTPLLFVFGVLSIILNALQVELGVEGLLTTMQWQLLWYTCRWFAMITLICMFFLTLGLVLLLAGMIVDEWIFALKERRSKRKSWRQRDSKA